MSNPYQSPSSTPFPKSTYVVGVRGLFYFHLLFVALQIALACYFVASPEPPGILGWVSNVLAISILPSWILFPLAMLWLTSRHKLPQFQRLVIMILDLGLVAFQAFILVKLDDWARSPPVRLQQLIDIFGSLTSF